MDFKLIVHGSGETRGIKLSFNSNLQAFYVLADGGTGGKEHGMVTDCPVTMTPIVRLPRPVTS